MGTRTRNCGDSPRRAASGTDGRRFAGRGGIAQDVAERVQRLLAACWPKKRIAAECRVSRMTVHRLAKGQHVTQVRLAAGARPKFPRCSGCGMKCRPVVIGDKTTCRKCLADQYKAEQLALSRNGQLRGLPADALLQRQLLDAAG